MNNNASKQHGNPSNPPENDDVFSMMLEAMTLEELTDGLNAALENITDENYDPTLIDAYLAVLDRKDPLPETPDIGTSYADFHRRLLSTFPLQRNRVLSTRRFRHVWRVGLVIVLTVICLTGGIVVANAIGIDVFGAVARWTNNVFSLGTIRSSGAEDGTIDTSLENPTSRKAEYVSLQDALNDYDITEFSEPAWLPDGYLFENVEVDHWLDGTFIGLSASYYDGTNSILITVESYEDQPNEQVEKTDFSVASFVTGGFTIYLLENIRGFGRMCG